MTIWKNEAAICLKEVSKSLRPKCLTIGPINIKESDHAVTGDNYWQTFHVLKCTLTNYKLHDLVRHKKLFNGRKNKAPR